ncbi:MAG TPA: ADOP family duplicated permease [Acidobacteriota bacterium]|nr:ADOP family duplicated permease [Acidobacteriota bacterium]
MSRFRPPTLARRLLEWGIPSGQQEFLLGDLEEEARRLEFRKGRAAARRWYWRQSLAALAALSRPGSNQSSPSSALRRTGEVAMQTLLQDLRFGLRQIVKNPSFSLVAILTLALGIGANTAIFSVVDAILVDPLPYREPSILVKIWNHWPNFDRGSISFPEYEDFQEGLAGLQQIGLHNVRGINLTAGQGKPEFVLSSNVAGDLFPMLGVKPLVGRWLEDSDGQPGKANKLLLSYGLWQRRFGGRQDVVGMELELESGRHEVVGVMPQDFGYPIPDIQVWRPLELTEPVRLSRGGHNFEVLARLEEGTGLAQLEEQMDALGARLRRDYPQMYPQTSAFGVHAVPLKDEIVGPVRRGLLILLAAVGAVLLIACANVAHLMLARSSSRRRELAVRGAMGAGGLRLAGQMLAESVVLSALGGALGVFIAYSAVSLLRSLNPPGIPRLQDVAVDQRALALTVLLTLLSALLFGLAPARRAWRMDLCQALREDGRQSSAGGRLKGLLVATEVALAVMLLVGAGLLMRSFLSLQNVDPGFDSSNLLTARVQLSSARFPDHQARSLFLEQVLQRLQAQPGVEAAAVSNTVPMAGFSTDSWVTLEGYQPETEGEIPSLQYRIASPRLFKALGIDLLDGRVFQDTDRADSPQVVIVSRSTAEKYWPGENPIGKRLKIGWGPLMPWREVVGVVSDVRQRGLDVPPDPTFYAPLSQRSTPWSIVLVRGRGAALPNRLIEEQVQAVDPAQPVYAVRTMDEIVYRSQGRPRFNLVLLGVFAASALLLSVVGIYGVISYSVGRRRHDIGVGLALGARPRHVLALAMGREMKQALAGALVGVAGALLLGQAMEGLLFGVDSFDPATLLGVLAVLLFSALLAGLRPAQRALTVDPVVALRGD